jgi:flagellar basal-body rod protein FlgB
VISPISAPENYLVAGKLLDAAVLRQQAIAANIANAETPGYQRLDLSSDFARQLKTQMARGDLGQLSSLQPTLAQDPHARSMRPDGNTVEIENELLEMNRNTVEYNYLTEVVSGNLRQLKTAITGRTS